MDRKAHWERVYATKGPTEVSWYQALPSRSLELILLAGVGRSSRIIDVGGGDSTLVDTLVDWQLGRVTVLDISGAALERARARLGERARDVTWIEADVIETELPALSFDVWHDRAVFHFLAGDVDERRRYVERARDALVHGGHAIVATFAADGPTRCSGLDVARYGPDALAEAFGRGFELVTSRTDTHRTPSGVEQRFAYVCLRRTPAA